MFKKFFSYKKAQGETITWKIVGMHCTSCSLNIDATLEDFDGVFRASTTYASATSKVEFDPAKVSTKTLISAIQELGYDVKEI